MARIRTHRPPPPQPDGQWARRFERLYDLYFLSDNQGLLYLHGRWLQHAPQSWRARAMGVIWRSALGMPQEAARLEQHLLAEGAEDADPTGSATVLLHRGIARLWRGEVSEAFADGLDASERLLHLGDPYLAALATTVVAVAGFHLGSSGTITRMARELEVLGRTVHDDRAMEWAQGYYGVAAWIDGNMQEALSRCQAWAVAAARRQENTEAVAQRFLGEILLDLGRLEDAQVALARCDEVSARFHLVLDYTSASVIGWMILSARLERAGKPPIPGGIKRKISSYLLIKRSPRWEGRVKAALAWGTQGDERTRLFEEAERAARRLHLDQDVVWIRRQQELSG